MTTQNGEHVRPLIDPNNADILNAIRNEASPMFNQRIPPATQGNVRDSLENMMKFPTLRNEFYQALVNRIAGQYIHTLQFDNKLAEFKKAPIRYGKTYEEVAVGLAKAHVYDPNQEYLAADIFGTYKNEVKSVFHTVNREEWYGATINESQLRYAFTQDDGLRQLISQVVGSLRTSDNLDEFLQMCHLFAEYARMGGYWRIHTDDVRNANSTPEMARTFLRQMRTIINTLPLQPWTKYNAAHMPSVVKKDDLIFFMSPELHAAIDVNGLAMLFNEEYAKTANRIIDIPQENFGLNEGVQCIITTRDFFFCWDYLYETTTSGQNPVNLAQNTFLHHKEALSLSPFVPAVLMWTGDGSLEKINLPEGTMATKPEFQLRLSKYGEPAYTPDGVERGNLVQVVSDIEVEGNPTFKPSGIRYKLETEPKSQFTHITNTGVLVVGLDETLNELKVSAQATYINPATPEIDSVVSASLTVPVKGEGLLGFAPMAVTKLDIMPAKPTVNVGGTTQLHAVATLTDGRTPDVTNLVAWSVDNPATATIDNYGKITGVATGTANVSATVFTVEGKKDVTVSAA